MTIGRAGPPRRDLNRRSGKRTLFFEKLPYVALSKTYSWDQQTPDSAPTMTAMVTGYKARESMLAVNHTTAQTARNKKLLEEKDPVVRQRNHDRLRRTAADPKLAREFLLRTSLIQSVQEAAAIE